MNKDIDNDSLDSVSMEDIQNDGNDAVTESVADVAADSTPAPAVAAATVAASAPVDSAPRKRAGRPFDATGKTKLGQARILYAQNASLAPKELKKLFVEKLGVAPQVGQTYASLVRRK